MPKKREIERLINKYRDEIASLEEREQDIYRRIEILENLLPTVLVWYMWKVSQANRETPKHESEEEAKIKLEHLQNVLRDLQQADQQLKEEEQKMRKRIEDLEKSLDDQNDEFASKMKAIELPIPMRPGLVDTKDKKGVKDPIISRSEGQSLKYDELLQDADTDWKKICDNLLEEVRKLNEEYKNSAQKLQESDEYVKQLEDQYSMLEQELQEKIELLKKRTGRPWVVPETDEEEKERQLQKEIGSKEALSAMEEALLEVKSTKEALSKSSTLSKDHSIEPKVKDNDEADSKPKELPEKRITVIDEEPTANERVESRTDEPKHTEGEPQRQKGSEPSVGPEDELTPERQVGSGVDELFGPQTTPETQGKSIAREESTPDVKKELDTDEGFVHLPPPDTTVESKIQEALDTEKEPAFRAVQGESVAAEEPLLASVPGLQVESIAGEEPTFQPVHELQEVSGIYGKPGQKELLSDEEPSRESPDTQVEAVDREMPLPLTAQQVPEQSGSEEKPEQKELLPDEEPAPEPRGKSVADEERIPPPAPDSHVKAVAGEVPPPLSAQKVAVESGSEEKPEQKEFMPDEEPAPEPQGKSAVNEDQIPPPAPDSHVKALAGEVPPPLSAQQVAVESGSEEKPEQKEFLHDEEPAPEPQGKLVADKKRIPPPAPDSQVEEIAGERPSSLTAQQIAEELVSVKKPEQNELLTDEKPAPEPQGKSVADKERIPPPALDSQVEAVAGEVHTSLTAQQTVEEPGSDEKPKRKELLTDEKPALEPQGKSVTGKEPKPPPASDSQMETLAGEVPLPLTAQHKAEETRGDKKPKHKELLTDEESTPEPQWKSVTDKEPILSPALDSQMEASPGEVPPPLTAQKGTVESESDKKPEQNALLTEEEPAPEPKGKAVAGEKPIPSPVLGFEAVAEEVLSPQTAQQLSEELRSDRKPERKESTLPKTVPPKETVTGLPEAQVSPIKPSHVEPSQIPTESAATEKNTKIPKESVLAQPKTQIPESETHSVPEKEQVSPTVATDEVVPHKTEMLKEKIFEPATLPISVAPGRQEPAASTVETELSLTKPVPKEPIAKSAQEKFPSTMEPPQKPTTPEPQTLVPSSALTPKQKSAAEPLVTSPTETITKKEAPSESKQVKEPRLLSDERPSLPSLAAQTLESKLRVKDHLIKTMADQLRELERDNTWTDRAELEAVAGSGPVKTYDFDRNLLFRYLDSKEPQNYEASKKESSDPSSNSLNVKVLRKLDKDSLLIEWSPAASADVVGFQVYLNGEFMYWVHSAKRNLALLHPLDLRELLEIAVSPIDERGHIISRSIIIYNPQLTKHV